MGSNHTCLPVINLDSALNKLSSTSNFKSVNALKKKLLDIINELESTSDNSDDSNEEYIKVMGLIFFRKVILKMSSLKE